MTDFPTPASPRDREILRGLARRIARGDAGAHSNLGVLYFSRGMLEEALAQFQLALDLEPGLDVARVNQAETLLALDRPAATAVICRRILAGEPEHVRALFLLASAVHRLGRTGEAIEALVTLLSVDASHLEALIALGPLLVEAGRPDDARRAFERILRIQPANAAALAALESLGPGEPDLRRSA